MKELICSTEKNKKKGFTLTEILVVVMVVAVLAAVAYPLYTKAATKSRAIEAINLLEMVRNKQLSKYARDKAYYTTATGLGQLTSNLKHETLSGAVLQVKDYTISLNSVKNCATAAYSKGNTTFSFSSGYDTAGLGCTGDVCSSFGNIVGTAKDVCNCGSKSCSNGYTLNEDTCNCDCLLGCDQGGTCFAPYGGGSTRACSSGCGTESSASTCNGATWSGTCWSPTQTLATSQGCGNSGTQTRTCTANCSGGSCGEWGACTGQTCPAASKPAASEACGNCGTRTRSVTCNTNTGGWETGSWGTCSGQGVCAVGNSQSCGTGGTQICSSSCAWGTCNGQDCPAASKPTDSEACGNCNTGTRTRLVGCNTSTYVWTTGEWSACSGGGVCEAGKTQTCNTTGTQTCSSSCTWGTCSVQPCSEATKPTASQACGNCGTGTQTRTVTCNTATGTWTSSAWTTCSGGGVCEAGKTQTCGGGQGVLTCSSSCAWGSCVCNSGYSWNGSTCASNSCDPATKPNYSSKCGCGDLQYTYTCDLSTLTWKVASTQCINTHTCSDPNQTRSCGGGNGTQKCGASCEWSSALACVCNTGYTWNGSTCIAQCTGCTPGETQTIIPSAPYGVAGTKTCTTSCTWQVSCPTNSQWNSGYNSCIARHPIGHETKSWICGAYVSASTCTLAHCLSTGINGCNVPGQNTACTGAVSCAENAVSRVNYDCTVYPYEVLSVAAVKQANGMYVCDCKYNVYNVYCSYDPNTSY